MASINLDRKSRLKFGLSRDMQVSLYDLEDIDDDADSVG